MSAIAGAAHILAHRSVTDIPTILIAVLAFAVLSFTRILEPLLIVATAVAGVLIQGELQ